MNVGKMLYIHNVHKQMDRLTYRMFYDDYSTAVLW